MLPNGTADCRRSYSIALRGRDVLRNRMTGQKVSRMLVQRRSNETVKNEFTDEERKKML